LTLAVPGRATGVRSRTKFIYSIITLYNQLGQAQKKSPEFSVKCKSSVFITKLYLLDNFKSILPLSLCRDRQGNDSKITSFASTLALPGTARVLVIIFKGGGGDGCKHNLPGLMLGALL
jgi:hypothetical protein